MFRRGSTLRPGVAYVPASFAAAFPTFTLGLAGLSPTSLFACAEDCISAGAFKSALAYLKVTKERAEANHPSVSPSPAPAMTSSQTTRPTPFVDYLRALCYLRLKDPLMARAALKEEVLNFPNNADAVDLLGRVNTSLKRSFALPHPILESEPLFARFYQALISRDRDSVSSSSSESLRWSRLFALYCHAKEICESGLEGDFVECAPMPESGGDVPSAVLLSMVVKAFDTPRHHQDGTFRQRKVFLCSSYRGPTSNLHQSTAELQALTETLGGADIIQVNGALGEVLPSLLTSESVSETDTVSNPAATNNIALLHIDCEWYNEADAAMRFLFPSMVRGGVLQIEDMNYWDGCRQAVTEHLSRHGYSPRKVLHAVDSNAVWMRKE